jgi:Uma2 family endonuclease
MGLPKTILTEDEYLTFERAAEERHIYVDGQVFAMAGGSPAHHTICTNVVISLGNQLADGPCQVWTQNARVRSGPLPKSPKRPSGLYSYPDIIVICDEPKFLDEHEDVLLNPKALVEVLSESTEAFDRGDKLLRFQKYNPSLTDYILIRQDRPQIENFRREKDGSWNYAIHEGMKAVVKIENIKCRLKATEVYKRVKFEAGEEE